MSDAEEQLGDVLGEIFAGPSGRTAEAELKGFASGAVCTAVFVLVWEVLRS